jgi:hypothetical protein
MPFIRNSQRTAYPNYTFFDLPNQWSFVTIGTKKDGMQARPTDCGLPLALG